jgi:hypothetical protein
MSAVEEIMSQIPLSRLAEQLGVDEETAANAARHALPALLGGIQANADDPGGAASFGEAVQQHDAGLIEGGVDLDQVDTSEGDKIVNHVFGPNRDQVAQQLGGVGGVGGEGIVAKLLPLLAPIVMSYLAKKLAGGGGAGGGGGLGDLLGGVLGGAAGGSGGGPDLGGLLGGLLGGGGAGGSGEGSDGPDLGGLLGGLLGGGRK